MAQDALSEAQNLQLDIADALDMLQYARADGDKLKIALCEASLNDLLDRYTCHCCHGSQPAKATA